MSKDTGDSVKDRFAERFEGGAGAESEKGSSAETSETTKGGSITKSDETAKSAKRTENIKKAWSNHSFYLPPELASDLGRSYKRLDLELDEEYGMSIQKTRHYYPLVVQLGLDRLADLERKEIKEELESVER